MALSELSEWIPRGFRTVTWTDLLATGNLRLLDNDLRRELSVYYGMQADRIESDDNQEPFRRYKSVASHLLKPEQRLMAMFIVWGGADPDTVSSAWEANDLPDPGIEVSTATTLSDDEFAALIDRLEATPGLEAMLAAYAVGQYLAKGNVRALWRVRRAPSGRSARGWRSASRHRILLTGELLENPDVGQQ